MSSEHGIGKVFADAAKSVMGELQQDAQSLQVDFLSDPITSEEMLIARDQLGASAGSIALARQVRENRRGRRPGSRNRANNDLVAYLRQFGPDPLVAAMKMLAEPDEMIIERSKNVDPVKRRMSLKDCRDEKKRLIEHLSPFFYGKKPVALELDVRGDFNLLVPGMNISAGDAQKAASGQFVLDADYQDIEEIDADG